MPTKIEIAPFTINPYRGCGFGCLYCYSQKNKCFRNRIEPWGEFVDVKTNFLEVLTKELNSITPERVLMGSTTEIYQQAEKEYQLTRGAIEILNSRNIPITILTKSNLIEKDIDILNNAKICLTINLHDNSLIKKFEKRSPSIEERINTLKKLKENNINAYVHVGPVFPELTDIEIIMEMVHGLTSRVNFESFNYWMSPYNTSAANLPFKNIYSKEAEYSEYWGKMKQKILELNKKYNYKINFFFHDFESFWTNTLGK